MTDLQARFAQLLESIETKVDQINQEQLEPANSERQTTDGKDANNQVQCEMDPARLRTRQRQLDIGKNSSSYETYIAKYPRYSCKCTNCPYFQH
jgi:Mg2+ and Co2+ transporter CorA